MFSYGLKLWSTNLAYIPGAEELLRRGIFQYVELFAVPGSLDNAAKWSGLAGGGVRYVVHAPHYMAGMNLADPESRAHNMRLAGEAFRFADVVKSEKIIFHPGVNGRAEEAGVQLKDLDASRILVENKPYVGLRPDLICVGHSPASVRRIMDISGVGFCLDIGHALAAAFSLNKGESEMLDEFFALGPSMFHVADGQRGSACDGHLHLGGGNYDFPGIVARLPRDAWITLETEKKYKDRLDDCESDVRFLESLAGRAGRL